MSWAALNQQLRGLLPRFSLPVDEAAAHDLSERLFDIGGEGGALDNLQASGVEPSPAETAALRK